MRVAVVGGGITGVAVADRLARSGVPVVVFERSAQIGGLAGAFRLGETRLDKYFHHIFLSDTTVRARIAELGLDGEMSWKVTPMGFYGAGKIHPFDGPLDLLRFSALSLPDRIRFGLRTLGAGRMQDGLSLDDRTAKEWVESDWGGEIYARFWGPLLRAKFADAADRISAAWLWGRIYARANSRAGGKEKLGYLRGSFARLVEAMAERVRANGGEVCLSRSVRRIERGGPMRFRVATPGGEEDFTHVVVAVPSPLVPELCPDLPPDERAAHAAIAYVSVSCMPVLMDRPLSRIYWLNVGDPSIPFTGVIEQTNYLPPSEYGGHHVAYLFNYLPQGHPWMTLPKEKLFAIYEEGLRRIYPGYRREQVKAIHIFRDLHANAIYERGYLAKRPPTVSKLPGLFFANTAHIFPEDRNQNFSIVLAERVAAEVLSETGIRPPDRGSGANAAK